jgi:hypothetical protein
VAVRRNGKDGKGKNDMRKLMIGVAAVAALAVSGVAQAQSGHFLTEGGNTITCADIGTQLRCTGKVTGLGGTTFEIVIEAEGTAIVECENPAGNVAPGQDTAVDLEGGTGELPTPRNGNFRFNVVTTEPDVPNTPTCPNPQWTANVVDVVFTDATLSLFEDDVLVDQVDVL